MTLATISLPDRITVDYRANGTWHSSDALAARAARAALRSLPLAYYPNPVRNLAEAVAEALGGVVIYAEESEQSSDEDGPQ